MNRRELLQAAARGVERHAAEDDGEVHAGFQPVDPEGHDSIREVLRESVIRSPIAGFRRVG